MNDPYGGRASLYLTPMQAFFIAKPLVVVTVLGSCLCVTMFHRRTGMSAICHALLPKCGRNGACPERCDEQYKYVDCSIRTMAARMERFGAMRSELEVKTFGGADMFTVQKGREDHTIGAKNVRAALDTLARERLFVTASNMGGNEGRKIYFYSDSGEVMMKRLRNTEGMNIFLVEKMEQAKD